MASTTTTQKHQDFVSAPMLEKSVDNIAGIGSALTSKLSEEGFDKAYTILGQFLLLKKNKKQFIDWLKTICGANAKQAEECFQCIHAWTQSHV